MLKIKDEVDLKELEKFGFEKKIIKEPTHKFANGQGKEDYYTEIFYSYDNGINTIDVVEKRINSDWIHNNHVRELYTYPNDYELGISRDTLNKIYDLIQSGLVEKIEERN